jgi:hypothetical protein
MSIEEPSPEDWRCKHEPLSGLYNTADSPFLHPPQPGNAFVTLRNDSMAVMVAEKFIRAGEEVGRLAMPFTEIRIGTYCQAVEERLE